MNATQTKVNEITLHAKPPLFSMLHGAAITGDYHKAPFINDINQKVSKIAFEVSK